MTTTPSNPLLKPFNTPFGQYPFEEITAAHIREAIDVGMAQEAAEIESIASNPAAPTFANTIAALDASGQTLDLATRLMHNLLSANTNDSLEQVAEDTAPLLAQHASAITLNAALFARIKAVKEAYERADQQGATALTALPPLTAEERMLLNETYADFERAGATLPEDKKARFREIKARLSALSLKFSQNLLRATNAFTLQVPTEAPIIDLPEAQRKQAHALAQQKGMTGYLFTLQAPSYVPFMSYVADRDLRRQLYFGYNQRATQGENDNTAVCTELVNLRGELARLLGYPTYADYVLCRRMAETPANAQRLLHQLLDAYKPAAQADLQAVREFAQKKEGKDFQLEPWDFAYYSRLLKLERYNLDSEMLRSYLPLDSVTRGVFNLAERLYGITFHKLEQTPRLHADATTYEVHDGDGSYLGLLYLDFYPRATKRGGAWMTDYMGEYDYVHRPHVSVTCNFTPPIGNDPALITFSELETFLHEFGHALHGLFAATKYRSLSGTNVKWDFVELPSQLMENFATERAFLDTFARHYRTGEPLPQELLDRLRTARNFQAGYTCLRQLSFGLLDLALYSLTEPLAEPLADFERKAWSDAQLLPLPQGCCMTPQFSHIMAGGYAAGYYSYKWAEVLDADAFEAFREGGTIAPEVAARFRENILSKGGTVSPAQLYRSFRGKDASIDALLRRDGITSAKH